MGLVTSLVLCASLTAQAATPAIAAHRGAMHAAPENTMAAFEQAVALGADILEVDVRASADGRLFVLHDSTLDRTTDGEGPASALTLAELQVLDAGGWFGEAYAGLRIPSLEDVLEWGKGRTRILLDLKEASPAYTDAVADVIEEHGDPAGVIIGVRSVEQAREFRVRIPECEQLGFMASPEDIEGFAKAGVEVLRLWLRWVKADPDLPGRVRAAGARLMINGSHGEVEEARALMKYTPDWILINDIEQLRESLEALE